MHTSQPRAPLFPYTTLFRSGRESAHRLQQIAGAHPGPLHRVNQEVANGKQRAEVQPVMDEAGMLEQLGRATDVISKLRVRRGGQILGQKRASLRRHVRAELAIPPLHVLPPDAVAENFFGASNAPPEFRMYPLQDLEYELWRRSFRALRRTNRARGEVDETIDDRNVKVVEQHTVLARASFEPGHHRVRD